MTGVHGAETAAMVEAFDFSHFGTVIDVGGGNGTVIAAILQRYPSVRGVLYDLPHVVERARPRLEAAGVAQRCQTVGGDFFTAVPPGGELPQCALHGMVTTGMTTSRGPSSATAAR